MAPDSMTISLSEIVSALARSCSTRRIVFPCLAYDSKASYMILSLMEPEQPVLNSFHIEGDESTKEDLVIC